jgi:hypothetical protein
MPSDGWYRIIHRIEAVPTESASGMEKIKRKILLPLPVEWTMLAHNKPRTSPAGTVSSVNLTVIQMLFQKAEDSIIRE